MLLGHGREDEGTIAVSRVRAAVLLIGLLLSSSALGAETTVVAEALDGDTVLLKNGQQVRYLGVNTPERHQSFHQKALELNRVLTVGKTVRLEFDREREDRYGRLLAYVYVGQEMVNARLLREGLAHVYMIPPNLMRAHEFLRLQEEAKAKGLGLWANFKGPLKITTLEPGLKEEEYVRIANVTARALNLKDYKLSDRAGRTYIFPSVVLPPGYALTLFSGLGRDARDPEGAIRLYWNSGRPIWNNTGDTAFLRGPDGEPIDRFDFLPPRRGRDRPR